MQPAPPSKIDLGEAQAVSLSDEATPRTPPPPPRRSSDGFSGWAGPVVLSYLFVGTAVFSVAEGWSPRDALYFCVTALTTVGYGDLAPTSAAGKLFCCAYVVTGVSLSSACLGVVLGRMQASPNPNPSPNPSPNPNPNPNLNPNPNPNPDPNPNCWMQARVISTRLFSALGSSASASSSSAQGRPHVTSIIHSAAGLAALVASGAVFAHLSEGWSALDSVCCSIIEP